MPDDPSWRTFFDEIPRWDEKPGEKFVQLNGAEEAGRVRALGSDQRLPAAPGRLRRRDRHLPAGRSDVRPDARAGGHRRSVTPAGTCRTTVEQNLVLPLGAAEQGDRPVQGAEGDRPRRAGRGHDRRRHRLPRHRHVQARHRLIARPRRRAAHAAGGEVGNDGPGRSATCASRSPAASIPAASTTSPTSASTATAATSAGTACRTSR